MALDFIRNIAIAIFVAISVTNGREVENEGRIESKKSLANIINVNIVRHGVNGFSQGENIVQISVLSPQNARSLLPESILASGTDFWRSSIIYHVYPRSFIASDSSRIGDLKGIASKADYFREIGIGIVWLSPIYKSPMADFGYDISDFTDVDPIFGTLEDFDFLLQEMHSKGIKVVMDFVPNHSSDEHQWFAKSVRKENPYTNYYIWADPLGYYNDTTPIPPSNWLSVFRGSAWKWVEERQQFYLHQFLDKQPDLNYRCPELMEEMKNVLRFWLDRGVDGFRLDAIKFLFEVEDVYQNEAVAENSGVDDPTQYEYLNHTLTTNLPELFDVLREWRTVVDKNGEKILMAEVYDNDINEVMKYYGNETDKLCEFPFNFNFIDYLQNRSSVTGTGLKEAIDLWLNNMPLNMWPNWVLGNHDNGRVASRLGVDLVDSLNMLSLLLPGTPVTYYGEEIGMENTFISYEDTEDPAGCNYGPDHYMEYSRDPERTPMQWDNSSFAGFTTGNSTWLPINENYKTLNVEMQRNAEYSHLKVYQQLAALRQELTFLKGKLAYPIVTEDVFSFVRYLQGYPTYLLVINAGTSDSIINLGASTNFELPEYGEVLIRSSSDSSNETIPSSQVPLAEISMVAGEGIVFRLVKEE